MATELCAMSDLKSMKLHYVYTLCPNNEIKAKIEDVVKAINPEGDYDLKFGREEMSFLFRNRSRLFDNVKYISKLLNNWAFFIKDSDIEEDEKGNCMLIVWS